MKLTFFLESNDGQSQGNDNQGAENIEAGHNLVNIIHKIFL